MFRILAKQRVVTGEIMDSPDIAPADHIQALAALKRINKISGVVEQMARPILTLARSNKLQRISLLDVACGGGDVPVGIAKRLKQQEIEVDLTLLDRSSTALSQAAATAERAGISCQVVQQDATEISAPRADVVTSSLFLHHLNETEDVIHLLRSMRELARRIVVINDLQRSLAGFTAAWLGCRLLSRSAMVHSDGPVSVRAAWTMDELKILADKAGMDDAVIEQCPPWRMLLVWKAPIEK